MFNGNNTVKSVAETIGITDESVLSFMADMQKSGTVYQTSEEALAAYEAHLKTVGKTVDWAAAKNKLLSASLKVLSTVGWMVVATFATEVVSCLYQVTQVSSELQDKAEELGNTFKSTKRDIADYKDQIADLYKTINDSDSSIEEVTNARKDLMSIQDQLIEKYGSEKEVIDIITDAVDGQTEAFERLTAAQYQATKNKFNDNSGWENIPKKIFNWINGYESNYDSMIDTMENYAIFDFLETYAEAVGSLNKEDQQSFFNRLKNVFGDDVIEDVGFSYLNMSGELDEVYDKLIKLQELASDFDFNKNFSNYLTEEANDAKKVLDKYSEMYETYIVQEKILGSSGIQSGYDKIFADINEAYKKYQDSMISGDEKREEEAINEYARIVNEAIDSVKPEDVGVADFFKAMYPILQNEVATWKFKVDFSADSSELKHDLEFITDFYLEDWSKEDLLGFNKKTSNFTENTGYNKLNQIADRYELSYSELIDLLEEFDLVESQAYKDLVDYFGQDAVDKLTPENLEIAYTISSKEADKAIEEEKNKIKKVKTELESLSKEGNVDLTIRPVIDSSAMQEAGWDVEDGSIATTFTQGEFIWQGDEENGQYVYVHYTPILPDGTVLTPDELTDYLYGTLEGSQNILDADDKGLVLKVDADLNIPEDDIKKFTNGEGSTDAIDGLIEQTGEWDNKVHDIQEQYYETGNSIAYASNALDGLIEKHKELQNPDKINNLFANLLDSKDALEDFISAVESASDAYSTLMNPNVSTSDMLSSILSITEAVSEMGGKLNWEFIESSDNSLKLLGDTIDYVSEKYTKSALVDAGFGEEFAEVLANSIVESQKAARELENVNTQIDSLQAAYDDLTDIVKTYNKTGYITFDQLQTLLEMEPQYLACLVDENGQLRLNQQSMLELANMRLNEAQTQAVQQAISELGALAIQNETTAIEDNEDAREEQIAKIEEYNSRLAESIAEISVETALIRELNEEMGNASSNGASDEQINTVLDNLNTKLQLINKTREGLTGNLGKIVSSSSSSTKDDFEETFNWVETIISRIQRTITNLGKTVSATYKKWSTRNNALAQEMSAINQEIAAQQNAYNTYMSKANSVNLSEHYKELVRNGGFSIEDITDETLAENIKLYQEWYDKALECSDAIDDLRGNLAELAMTKFENVSKEYDDRLALIEHHTSMLDGYVSRAEAAGFWVSEVYYQKMAEKELENINQLQGKYNDLIATFNENVSNGSIEKYSEDWYEMRIEIDDVESALQEANTALVEFNQTLQQIHWDLFDRVNDYKDALIEESNFLAEMISRDDLYNTYGSLTDEGLAVQGLHAVNYNAYMEKAADYAEEIQKINEEIANDPNDLELVDRRNELLNLQQESIENAMAEKDAIRDLISDGYDIMLDSLDELINKRKEALNAEKDLYDYQNSIKEKTDTISSYRKQLDAYSGDNSEEARATIQKLQLGLEEAENDLQETEYEKWLSDQEAMLDDLYDQTEEWINGRLDNIDGLVSEAITATNENASTISETIFSTADTLGYSLSEYANTLWSSASDNTDTLVKAYENVAEGISGTISNGITTLQTVLDSIDLKMQSMIEDLNTQAAVESESIGQSQVQIVEEQNNYNTSDDSQSSQPSSSGIVFTGGTFYEDSYKGGKTGNSKQQWTDHEVEITGESSTGMVHIVDKTTGTILGWVDKDQLQGYATGTTNAKKGLNLVSEMGDEIIQDNDGNIILANGKQFFPFEGGETVFDASETAELLKGNLIPLNTEQLWGNIIKTPDYSGLMARSGNVANDIQLNIAVKANNYDEFVSSFKTAIKSDPQCRKLLQAVTVDELTNKGGLSRNKF